MSATSFAPLTNLADRARKATALPEAKFEAQVARAVKIAVAAAEDDKAVRSEQKPREKLIQDLADGSGLVWIVWGPNARGSPKRNGPHVFA
jgi:hypothetical protein